MEYSQHSLANAIRENKDTGVPEALVEGGIGTSFREETTV